MPGLHVLDLALRLAGKQADEHLKAKGEKMGKLQEAAGVLQKSFRIVVNDRAPIEQSKKWGGLHVINNLFKIYFRLNNLRLCQNLIRAVEGPGFPRHWMDRSSLAATSLWRSSSPTTISLAACHCSTRSLHEPSVS